MRAVNAWKKMIRGWRKWVWIVLLLTIVGAAVVVLRRSRGRPRPDRPLAHLGLSDQQARKVEDWSEAHPYAGYWPNKDFDKARQATPELQDAFLRTVLNPEQLAEYLPRNRAPGWQCINTGCPAHGRIMNPRMTSGYIGRHLPRGWDLELDVTWSGKAALLTGRKRPDGKERFRVYMMCRSDRDLPAGLRRQGLSELKPAPDALWGRMRAFVKIDAPLEETRALVDLFRRAFLCDMVQKLDSGESAEERELRDF